MLLGLPGDATYANYREANKALWRQAILPLAGKILEALAQGLRPWFAGLEIAVDLDQVTALAEDRERLWAQVGGVDFLTLNEKRALIGYAPVELGEEEAEEDADLDAPEADEGDDDAANAADVEAKFNPWHDPENGQFTSVGQGVRYGSGGGSRTDIAQMAKRPTGPIRVDRISGARTYADGHVEVPLDPPKPYRQELGAEGSAVIAKWEGKKTKPYVPVGARSGVTIGIGYDMGERTASEVARDLTAAGVDREMATALAKASGLKGAAAKEHLRAQKMDLTIGDEQARRLFMQTANVHANNVRRLVKVPLTQNQFDALVSLDYNAWLGPKSSIIQTLNSNTKTSYAEAADQFLIYNKIKTKDSKGRSVYRVSEGLVNRRADERTLFLTPG